MIEPIANSERHIEDGDLIRLLDGECEPAEERSIREHLRACARCRAEADGMEQLSRGFGLLLHEADSVPALRGGGTAGCQAEAVTHVLVPRWTRLRVLKAAAVVALLITAIGVSPARGWLADGWQALRSLFSGESAEPSEPPPPVEAPTSAAVVRFTPVGSTFTIAVASAQSRGTVSLAIDQGPSASARILGEEGGEELVVLRSGLRIVNAPTSSASYEIALPRSVTMLELTVADRTVLTLDEAELSVLTRQEIELAPPNR